MDLKSLDYLYHRARGLSREETIKEAKLTADEYDILERENQDLLTDICSDLPAAEHIGENFLRLTRYVYASASDQEQGITRPPAIRAREGELLALPAVGKIPKPSMSLHEAIEIRRSLRKYSDASLTEDELSFLLWSCSWARDFRSSERLEITLRNVPSAGARHPLETYLYIHRVEGFKPGLYYYHPVRHALVCLDQSTEKDSEILEACFRQEMLASSAVNFIWTAVPYRTIWRYGQRSYRYLYLDAGHVGQNLHLAAEAIGAGTCMIGAYCDEMMNAALSLDEKEEFVIYIASLGKKE